MIRCLLECSTSCRLWFGVWKTCPICNRNGQYKGRYSFSSNTWLGWVLDLADISTSLHIHLYDSNCILGDKVSCVFFFFYFEKENFLLLNEVFIHSELSRMQFWGNIMVSSTLSLYIIKLYWIFMIYRNWILSCSLPLQFSPASFSAFGCNYPDEIISLKSLKVERIHILIYI